ncbi:MAG: AAA family ATPase [Proteobacteria bacterium]|nr:AAA family ATPase [Pseudomonadota bacterium]
MQRAIIRAMLKKLPIGKQTFSEIIEDNCLYVDKTAYIYELLSSGSKAHFLSRPRRFGKSLLVSTLGAIFRNKRHLFKGLWIDSSDYVWKEYPVINLDISAIEKDTSENLYKGLKSAISDIAENHSVKLDSSGGPSRMFQLLIHELAKKYGEKVVVLVDEYDDPIIKHVTRPEMAAKNREVLHDFYKIMKSEDANLRFIFLTGVSKFAKTSIFSGLNNLVNISMQEKYSALLGITQEELNSNFSEYIDLIAEKRSISRSTLLAKIKYWYNGYRFSESEIKVYNPFSTLCFFNEEKFNNFWFESGTPTYLVELIKLNSPDIEEYEGEATIIDSSLKSYDVDSIPLLPILYDTGYLTIKDFSVRNDITRYTLCYPNFEVKNSLIESLLKVYIDEKRPERANAITKVLEDAILENDLEKFFSLLKPFFASIPYEVIPVKNLNEKYFQLIFYLLMRVTSFRVNTEDRTSSGRIDLVLENDSDIYLFEFKVDSSPEAALKQIKDKKYYEKYLNIPNKQLHIIGINFNSLERNLGGYLIETL